MAIQTFCDKCGERTEDHVTVLIEDEDSDRQWELCEECEGLLVDWLMQKRWKQFENRLSEVEKATGA